MNSNLPITEADLHAFVDGQLTPERQHEIAAYLASRPDEAQRVDSYRVQKRELRALFDPVLDEAVPTRLLRAARPRTPWYLQRLAAGVVIAIASGTAGWGLRGGMPGESGTLAMDTSGTSNSSRTASTSGPSGTTTHITTVSSMSSATGFAQRAAVAHAVYSPDQRRAVEVDAEHKDQLVAWLSKRMGTPMKPPHLQALGYSLEGGRLLPGDKGPVAQFMYRKAQGEGTGAGSQGRLTLYVSSEIGDLANPSSTSGKSVPGKAPTGASGGKNTGTAFSFAQQGKVNVFYWVDGPFGYAISADADPAELARVSNEVYRQLDAAR